MLYKGCGNKLAAVRRQEDRETHSKYAYKHMHYACVNIRYICMHIRYVSIWTEYA